MLAVTHNEVLKAIEIELDRKGIDVLIDKLQDLKRDGDHIHIMQHDGLTPVSMYGSRTFGQLILTLLADDISQEEIDEASAAQRQAK